MQQEKMPSGLELFEQADMTKNQEFDVLIKVVVIDPDKREMEIRRIAKALAAGQRPEVKRPWIDPNLFPE